MSGDNGKVVRGVEAQRAHEVGQEVGPVSKESPSMGEVMPPQGLPPNIKVIVITYDVLNDNIQVAGPLAEKELVDRMFDRAAQEVEKFWDKMKSQINN